jgi:ABC-type phosphate transport system substrate-binding protein
MTVMFRHKSWVLFLLVCAFALAGNATQLAVVVEKKSATKELTAAELIKIFTFKTSSWPDGRPVVLVLRDPGSDDMQVALARLYSMSADELKTLLAAHKKSVVFATSDNDLVHIVASTHGAIGLINVYSISDIVNIVKIEGKLPLQADYFLRGK